MKLQHVVIALAVGLGVYLVGTAISSAIIAFLAPLQNFLTVAA